MISGTIMNFSPGFVFTCVLTSFVTTLYITILMQSFKAKSFVISFLTGSVIMAFSVFLHEIFHLIAFEMFGYSVVIMNFEFLGANVTPNVTKASFTTLETLVIYSAGVIANILIAFVAYLISRLLSTVVYKKTFSFFSMYNVALAASNLIPFGNSDGKQVLHSLMLLLTRKTWIAENMIIVTQFVIAMLAIFVLIHFIWNFNFYVRMFKEYAKGQVSI